MANNLADVVPVLIAQGLQTLRAACVMPRLVNTDYSNTPANLGDTVNVWIPSAVSVADVAPSAAPIAGGDSQPVKAPIALNKWRRAGFYLTDKQQEEIVGGVQSKQTGEAVKALAEDINSFIFGLYPSVYGYFGTAGTTPFATDVSAATGARKILNLQRAPLTDRRLVLDVNAEANALGLAQLTAANQSGTDKGIIDGTIGRRLGFDWAMDQQVPTHPSVALSAGAATVNGVNAIGAGSTNGGRTGTVSIAKITNAGSFIAGDIITIAGDSQTYTVTANTTLIIGNTSVPIAPALQKATVGSEAVTLKAAHVVNLAFHRDAFAFVSRPLQSSSANIEEMMSVVDPTSGVAIRLEVVRQNKQMLFDFDVLYGAACVRPELAARMAG
jgi:P22 coat protein - gene protein 5